MKVFLRVEMFFIQIGPMMALKVTRQGKYGCHAESYHVCWYNCCKDSLKKYMFHFNGKSKQMKLAC